MFYLKDIKIVNFRCYDKYKESFSPLCNVIVGENAVGKTSLVEAIYFLCFGKSFKDIKDVFVIKENEEYYNILGTFVEEDEKTSEVMVAYDGKSKRIRKNMKYYSHLSDYVGYFKIVIFSPDDLWLVKGAPSVRRRFLDINISQIASSHMQSLIKYRKILKQRNEFLKNINIECYDKVLFDVITASLIKEAKEIIEFRQKYVDMINPYIEKTSKLISGNKEVVKIEYRPSCFVDNLEKEFKERQKYDILTKTTSIGPSRDDLKILINNQDATEYASQGQIKTAVLAIKLGISNYFKEKQEKLLIILDDVFSELDINRQIEILKLIDNKNQMFITTTSIDSIPENVLSSSKIIKLERRGA